MPDAAHMDAVAGVPSYTAQELRLIDSGLFSKIGSSQPFGARAGVIPNRSGAQVSISGSDLTVYSLNAIMYPTGSSQRGPYLCYQPEVGHVVPTAHSTLQRIDLVVMTLVDNSVDALGLGTTFRTDYITGTPGSGAPTGLVQTYQTKFATVTRNSVAAGGAATVVFDGPYTTLAGGVLRARTSLELPTSDVPLGSVAYREDVDALVVWNGAAWRYSNPCNTATVNDWQDGDYNFTNTSFGTSFSSGTYASCGVTFKAPLSGRVQINYGGCLLRLTTGGGAGNARISPQTRTGSSIGSGTIIEAASFDRCMRAGDVGFDARFDFGKSHILSGLTAGADYNTQLLHVVSSGTGNASDRRVSVVPVP